MEDKYMSKKTAHIISHSHWDREWYMSLEEHRYYLVKLFDDLLNTLAKDANFHSFHLDGQTIMVDDYLEIRPDKRTEVMKYLKESRLIIGPWYILQDAFLTSSEANIRNLLYGLETTKRLGQTGDIGYFPDTFGIYGQAPQILKQAQIDVAGFGRGVTPTGFNNQVYHNEFSSPYSELKWSSPDGSEVLGILFANWYSNGNEIPADNENAKKYWQKKLEDVEKFASTSQLLFLNGCDHQPLQTNITKAIEIANQLEGQVDFKHSSFKDYIADLRQELNEADGSIQTIHGELRNQKTDGWSTLVNTASSRIYLKQANDRCQRLLEAKFEPLGLFIEDKSLFKSFSEYYWKLLMENHPHDSICGCSVDSVHREMAVRFEKVELGVNKFVDVQSQLIANEVNTMHPQDNAIPLIVFNTSGSKQKKVIKKTVHIKKIYFDEVDFNEIPAKLSALPIPNYILVKGQKTLPITVKDLGVKFGYDLPEDQFRRPYYAKEIELTFLMDFSVQSGYETIFLVEDKDAAIKDKTLQIIDSARRTLENDYLHITIHSNGSFTMLDKETGQRYEHLGVYEDTGDIGNEYMYKESGDKQRFQTTDAKASVEVIENSSLVGKIRVSLAIDIPKSASLALHEEKETLVWHPNRNAERSDEQVTMEMITEMTLEKESKGLIIHSSFNNQVRDHRLRMKFPVGEASTYHYADSIYEVVERPNKPEPEWGNPSFDHHMQKFVSLNDDERGLTIATAGLHEYEIVDQSSIEITLLRSVGELGDWGVFDTPEAQCLGHNDAHLVIYPHSGNVIESKAYQDAYHSFDPELIIQTGQHEGNKPDKSEVFAWDENELVLTSMKPSLDTEAMILRWFNPTKKELNLNLSVLQHKNVYLSSVIEDKKQKLNNHVQKKIQVSPYEIVTVRIQNR